VTIPATKAGTALVFGLALILPACGGSSSGAAPSATSTIAATATSPETPVLGGETEELQAGAHVLDLVAREQVGVGPGPASLPKIEITVPEGWFNFKGISVGKGSTPPQKVFVFFWDVAQVYPTPCQWEGKPMVDPGRDVNGLASALAAQPLRNATAPTHVKLGGFEGKYLQMSVPSGVNFAHCDEGYFESWTANGWGSDRYQQRPGQVDRLWILDVDGERLVIDASTLPEATAQDRAELERVVDSIRFVD
jgi:hypothetical protein